MMAGRISSLKVLLVFAGLLCAVSTQAEARRIRWNGNWAFGCDFYNRDLKNERMPGEQCGGACARTHRCTHFAWTRYNGGTCWMKFGSVTKSDAFSTGDNTMVCGVV
ncbi:hypothetical protein BOX15_Mlig017410g3 [Macrostomum lignano]|uniref:Apple domain-containing protein n=1 Tax=Macrostomum lignano TaxID=282301 RepID=A0A267GAK6_9PLAT|nr:hypothetical protein BOX15_Mlig017410g3 [Macrostomum lignano]